MKVKSRLRVLTNVDRDEVFQFVQSVASISRSDVVRACGNYMTQAFKTIDNTGIVRVSKVSNAKIYHNNKKIDMSSVVANHGRSLVLQAFRDILDLKIGDPDVIEDGDWMVKSMATTNSIFRFDLIYLDLNRVRKISKLALDAAVPVYISSDEDLIRSLLIKNQLKLVGNNCLIAIVKGKSDVDLSMVVKDEFGKTSLTSIDNANRGLLIKIKHYPINGSIKSELIKKYDRPRFSNTSLNNARAEKRGNKNEKR